jgi:transposase
MDLKDEQWEVVRRLLTKPTVRADGRGRLRVKDREILNGILWIMRTGASWRDLPDRYPPYQTCHRRFREWVRAGVFEQVLRALVKDVKELSKLDLTECFVDGTFVIAKRRQRDGKDQAGQGYKAHGSGRSHWSSYRHIR